MKKLHQIFKFLTPLAILLAGAMLFSGIAYGTVEAVTYISDLNTSYPASGDARSEGDDHIRNVKTAVKNTFPNITGAVTPTQTELNYVDGVTSAIQTQLDTKITSTSLGLTLISSVSAASSPTVQFTASIDSTYDEYEIHLINVVPASNNVILWLRTTADGTTWNSTAGDYDWALVSNGSASAAGSNETKIILTAGVGNVTAQGGVSAICRISDPAGTAHNKRITCSGSNAGNGAGTGNMAVFQSSGMRVATAAIVGFQFLFSTGNIASGKVKLYGVRKS